MGPFKFNRRQLSAAAVVAAHTFTKTAPPTWLLAFWKEIDDKTWGKGFEPPRLCR
jgi:hypothetical protein